MLLSRPLTARAATPADRHAIQTLTRFEQRVHAHLDWRPVEDWLGAQPFLVAERGQRMVGALACPPDLPEVAWVRLIVVAEGVAADSVWDLLWPLAREEVSSQGVPAVAGLSLDQWTAPLYASAGFEHTHDVVVLKRSYGLPTPAYPNHAVQVRLARPEDYEPISQLDAQAFELPWRLSAAMVRLALGQAECVSVAQVDGQLVGYQLTTAGRGGAHLARLAVLPAYQGRGIGAALVTHLIDYYNRRGGCEISVNTQHNNRASLAVYQKLGFHLTGARFPVYQLAL
jgi:ribosomal-protein-alanine N-acetyltransferase